MPQDTPKTNANRIVQILTEMGWEAAPWLDEWNGQDIEALRAYLSEEDYQRLLDELEEEEIRA